MSNPTIAGAAITALEHPISALADRPALSADNLKAYFDANPQQLCDAHNALTQALAASGAAAEIGFSSTASIAADNVQAALENVHQQLSDVALGSVPDNSITTQKLAADVHKLLDPIGSMMDSITALNQAIQRIRPSGAQFPLMVLALSESCPAEMTDEIATAALGAHFAAEVYDMGIQLGWLCRWKNAALPSEAFRAKQTIDEIFADTTTLEEIETLTPVRSLISLSAEMSGAYLTALDNAQQ